MNVGRGHLGDAAVSLLGCRVVPIHSKTPRQSGIRGSHARTNAPHPVNGQDAGETRAATALAGSDAIVSPTVNVTSRISKEQPVEHPHKFLGSITLAIVTTAAIALGVSEAVRAVETLAASPVVVPDGASISIPETLTVLPTPTEAVAP